MGTGFFPGVKQPGREFNHLPPHRAEFNERVELYIYSPTEHSWLVLGRRFLCIIKPTFCQVFPLCSSGMFMFQHRSQITPEFELCLPESERRYGTACGDASWPDFVEIPNSARLMPVKQVMKKDSRWSTRLSLVLATLVAVGYHST
jgi:hypothetical protein